jgi:hypothetical protein
MSAVSGEKSICVEERAVRSMVVKLVMEIEPAVERRVFQYFVN